MADGESRHLSEKQAFEKRLFDHAHYHFITYIDN